MAQAYKIMKITMLIVVLYILTPLPAYAESLTSRVSIDVVQPENQIDKTVNYFDLLMQPSQVQSVTLKLTNLTEEETVMTIRYSSAKTTSNGEIQYSKNDEIELDESLLYDFEKIVTGPRKVNIPAKSEQEVKLSIVMPSQEFKGYISGGIEFIELNRNKEKDSSVMTESAYLIGMRLSETDEVLPTDIRFNKATIGLKNYQNAVIFSMSNIMSNYVEDMSVNIKIKKTGQSDVVLQSQKEKMRMAPNSLLNYPIYLEDQILEEGTYLANIQVKSENGFSKTWDEEFKVSKADRELLTENMKEWQSEDTFYNKLTIILTIVSLTLTVICLLYFNQKRIKNGR